MEKRVVLFLILSLVIVFGWNFIMEQMGWVPPPPSAPEEGVDRPTAQPPADAGGRVGEPLRDTAEKPIEVEAVAPAAALAGPAEETVVEVRTDLYEARFHTRGAVVEAWELARYTNPSEQGRVPVELVYQEGRFLGPLALWTSDETMTGKLRDAVFSVGRDFEQIDADHPVGRLTFRYQDPESGITVVKELTFHHGSYLVDVAVRTEGLGNRWGVNLGTNFGIAEWGEGFIGIVGPAFRIDGEIEKETPEQRSVRDGDVRWVALQDKYFISALIPEQGERVVITKEADKVVSAAVGFGDGASRRLRLYAGPKAFDRLKALGIGLEDTIDFGWFIYGSWDIVRWVAKPLFTILRFFYDYTHNYGWAIVLVTVCIKLLFVPLQYKSYKSMKDMQVVQPKVQELQKKYKDDRDRLNRELIKLYRDYKVNPLGGCLPMLLQMPVFIALFNILYMTIELRQAPFILWITDLSVPDPFYVLPILMGVSMVVQQKIMPTTMDPAQARIMLLLPVFLTFIFLNFAAGLVLYWFTNNVLTIAQQFITDRYIFKRSTFGPLVGEAPGTEEKDEERDGQKPSGRKKRKQERKAEADTPVES